MINDLIHKICYVHSDRRLKSVAQPVENYTKLRQRAVEKIGKECK